MSEHPARALRLFGTGEPPGDARRLFVGALSAVLQSGALRSISIGDVEVIRGIEFVVRDANWGSFKPKLAGLEIIENEREFRIRYDAECRDGDAVLRYEALIEGSPDGSLSFTASGSAASAFQTNRAGFVVLHPIEGLAGRPVRIAHTDGSTEESRFPATISPGQPFKDIRAVGHDIAPGLSVVCTLEGDTFEMEDQRNWSDASFKTYSRPLSEPRPYTLAANEQLVQRVSIEINGPAPARRKRTHSDRIAISIGDPGTSRMPELALALDPAYADAALSVAALVGDSGVRHLYCTFDPSAGHDGEDLVRFKRVGDAARASLTLEAVLPLRDDDGRFTGDPHVLKSDVAAIKRAAREAGVAFESIAVAPACYLKSYQPNDNWPSAPPLRAVYSEMRKAFPEAKIVGGMHSYFTELNRCPDTFDDADIIAHSTCPIVHAADDISVMQTLQALPWIFGSAATLAAGRPYWIGPTAIGMRSNPYGSKPMPNADNTRRAMAAVDPRQRGLFNAAWTLGYIARAAAGGVGRLCLSSIAGPNAISWQKMRWAQPWFDEQGIHGTVFPVYHVIAGLASHAGGSICTVAGPDASKLAALAIATPAGPELWLANLTAEHCSVVLPDLGPDTKVQKLDAETFQTCCADVDGFSSTATTLASTDLMLDAYAVARVSQAILPT